MLVVITDSEAARGFEQAFLEGGERPFTLLPTVLGRGRSGVHAGSRVHPGASSLLFTVVDEAAAAETVRFLHGLRDRLGVGEVTKIFSLPVEDVS
jgi:hypothetical protein